MRFADDAAANRRNSYLRPNEKRRNWVQEGSTGTMRFEKLLDFAEPDPSCRIGPSGRTAGVLGALCFRQLSRGGILPMLPAVGFCGAGSKPGDGGVQDRSSGVKP